LWRAQCGCAYCYAGGEGHAASSRNLLKRWSVTTAMTKPRPLALSHERLALVQQGAKGVPPEWHDRFVDAVSDELLLLDNITDADVNHAVTVVLLRIVMAV
jgi:hypothetical protein